MSNFTRFIFKLLFTWTLATAAGANRPPERRNIVSALYPVQQSTIQYPVSSINNPFTGVEAVPGYGISSINSLYYGTNLHSGTNAASGKVFISGLNLAPATGLSSGISISPQILPTSVTATTTTTGINNIYGRANILQKPGQTSTTSEPTRTVYTAETDEGSEIGQSSVNKFSSRGSINGIESTPATDVSFAISESSGNSLAPDQGSLIQPYISSVTTLPYGYKYKTKSTPGEWIPVSQNNIDRAPVNHRIIHSSGTGFSSGVNQGSGVGISSLNYQPSGKSLYNGLDQGSRVGLQNSQTSGIAHETSGTGVYSETKYSQKTTISNGPGLSSTATQGSENSLYSGSEHSSETDQYTGSAVSYESSSIDTRTGHGISSQVDRPILIPVSQNISVTDGRPTAVTFQQPTSLPLPVQVPVPVGSHHSVPVIGNLAVPAPLPFPIVKAILVPVGVPPLGGPDSQVSQGSNLALGSGTSTLSAKIAALGRYY